MSSRLRDVLTDVLKAIAVIVAAGAFVFGAVIILSLDEQLNEEIVSGIVYGAEFDTYPEGNTKFKVRASAEMAVTGSTSKTYCLPPNSPYEELVREAASDKDVKVVVKVKKVPLHIKDSLYSCDNNVEVTRKEQK